jgi:hypothetical protein
MVFGSNWPVSERFAPLATVFGIVDEYFSAHGSTARSKFFTRNACRIYLGSSAPAVRTRHHPYFPRIPHAHDFRLA